MRYLVILSLIVVQGCSTFGGGRERGGYEGPQQYARYFEQGHPEQVIDKTIRELSAELISRGIISKPMKWDWNKRVVVRRKQVAGWVYGFPVIEAPGGIRPVAYTSPSAITIGNDPNYVYKRSLFIHEFGHLLTYHNKVRWPAGFNVESLNFFKKYNGR